MDVGGPGTKRLDDLRERDEAVVEDVGELVEDHHLMLAAGDRRRGLPPGRFGRLTIARQIVALPGEAPAHHPEGEHRQRLREEALACLPLALDELDHRDPHAAAEGAKGEAQCRGCLSLALSRVDE